MWDYQKTDSKSIRKDLDLVNWELLFNHKDINGEALAFTETILDVFCNFRNYIPNTYITFNQKDLVWMNETIKSKINAKNILYKKYIQNRRFETDFILLKIFITEHIKS